MLYFKYSRHLVGGKLPTYEVGIWLKKEHAPQNHTSYTQGTVPDSNQISNPYTFCIDKGYTKGLESELPWSKQALWQEYLESYSKGEYKLKDKLAGLHRMYTSGGMELTDIGSMITAIKDVASSPLTKEEFSQFKNNQALGMVSNDVIMRDRIPFNGPEIIITEKEPTKETPLPGLSAKEDQKSSVSSPVAYNKVGGSILYANRDANTFIPLEIQQGFDVLFESGTSLFGQKTLLEGVRKLALSYLRDTGMVILTENVHEEALRIRKLMRGYPTLQIIHEFATPSLFLGRFQIVTIVQKVLGLTTGEAVDKEQTAGSLAKKEAPRSPEKGLSAEESQENLPESGASLIEGKEETVRTERAEASRSASSAVGGIQDYGGIDLSNIDLTLKDEKFISSLNPAERKVLLVAKYLKEGWNSLSLLYVHEIMLLIKDNLIQDLQNKDLLFGLWHPQST